MDAVLEQPHERVIIAASTSGSVPLIEASDYFRLLFPLSATETEIEHVYRSNDRSNKAASAGLPDELLRNLGSVRIAIARKEKGLGSHLPT